MLESNHPLFKAPLAALDDDALRGAQRELDLEIARRQQAGVDAKVPSTPSPGICDPDWVKARMEQLLADVKAQEADFRALQDPYTYQDRIYRFYHGTVKAYWLQDTTLQIRARLQALMPDLPLNPRLVRIIEAGTGHVFDWKSPHRWSDTLAITTAYFHARYFVDIAVQCVSDDQVPNPSNSDFAALRCLFFY